jgi:hypothetical protein
MSLEADSGTSATIVLKKYVKTKLKTTEKATKWKTMGGMFKTQKKATIAFKLPEFSNHKIINGGYMLMKTQTQTRVSMT